MSISTSDEKSVLALPGRWWGACSLKLEFQSQMRSQSPRYMRTRFGEAERERWFQSQMRSQSPRYVVGPSVVPSSLSVSISDEKPVPALRAGRCIAASACSSFQSQMRSQSPRYSVPASSIYDVPSVSISDEKPVPALRLYLIRSRGILACFNLR